MENTEKKMHYWEVLKPPGYRVGLGLREEDEHPYAIVERIKLKNKTTGDVGDFPDTTILIAPRHVYERQSREFSKRFREEMEPTEISFIEIPDQGDSAVIYRYYNEVYIKPIDERNGTCLNGRRLGRDPVPIDIYSGMKHRIMVGRSEFEIVPEYKEIKAA